MSTAGPQDLYAARPDLYDLMHADHVDDLRFLDEYVHTLDQPSILEVGCGTGRLLIPLLDSGAQVMGLDIEPAMLELARQRVAAYGTQARIARGDMRNFSLQERFDLAIVGLNTFMHMLTLNQQLDCLASLRRHLRAGGLLLLDLANPHSVLRDTPLGVLQHRFTRSALQDPDTTVTLWSTTTIAPAMQLAHSMLFFDEVSGKAGRLRRIVSEVMLRLTYRYELELLLARSGFSIRHVYGDYESGPYEDDSERLICVAAALS